MLQCANKAIDGRFETTETLDCSWFCCAVLMHRTRCLQHLVGPFRMDCSGGGGRACRRPHNRPEPGAECPRRLGLHRVHRMGIDRQHSQCGMLCFDDARDGYAAIWSVHHCSLRESVGIRCSFLSDVLVDDTGILRVPCQRDSRSRNTGISRCALHLHRSDLWPPGALKDTYGNWRWGAGDDVFIGQFLLHPRARHVP